MKLSRQKAPSANSDVKSRMVMVRGEAALIDRDVAARYDVQTKEENQAVRSDPAKFPNRFCIQNSDVFCRMKVCGEG